MNDTQSRLIQCFSAVFSGLEEEEIPRVTRDNMARWDSLANFSLIAVMEEEFGIQIEANDVDRLVSFASILDYLQSRNSVA
jgi:acyl carrier protein